MAKAEDLAASNNPVLTLALQRWGTAQTAENDMRIEGEKDLQFLNLEQWDQDVKDSRGESRPCLTIDQIGEPYRQLVGQMRGAKPAIQVNPVDNGADQDTAEVFQGLIRHIEITGGAKAAREEAFKGAVGPGWGYYRLITEYEYDSPEQPETIFDQCIKYQAIENAFTVFRDPATPLHEPWKCKWALVIEDVPKEEFEARWPNALSTPQDSFQATGLKIPEWYPDGSVRVADYFWVEDEPTPEEYALLEDGSVVPVAQVPEGVKVIQQRRGTIRTVKYAKITGAEILEGGMPDKDGKPMDGRIWPGQYIPIVPMFGESLTVKGKRNLRGIVRAARDPQRMYNYQNSELVYELALAPKSKVIMAEGQDEGYAKMWENAPSQAYSALMYKPTTLGDKLVPPPSVAQFTDPAKIQALVVAINQHKADLRSTTGWYDATDPNRKNTDQSGRAILARKEAQAEGAVNYKDSFGQALLYEGMILLDLIPKIYHRVGRVLRIVGLEDESERDEVTVGGPWKRSSKAQRGVAGIFQWGAGKFDVVPSIGQAYATRRQEAAETQMSLIEVTAKVNPQMAAVMVPAAIRNMDIPGAQDLADRAERTLPPQLLKDEDEDPNDPEALRAQLQQSEQMRQEAMQVVQQLQEAVKTDQVKAEAAIEETKLKAVADAEKTQQSDAVKLEIARLEIESKERIEAAKLEAERELAMMKIQADLEKAQITAEAQAHAAAVQAQAQSAMNGQRKVTKTIRRGPDGIVEGADEVHEGPG